MKQNLLEKVLWNVAKNLIGKCVATENDYYINNTNRAIMVSLVGGEITY